MAGLAPIHRAICLGLLLQAPACLAQCEKGWLYHGPCGAKVWSEFFESCGEKAQSPIDLPVLVNVPGSIRSKPFKFTNFDATDDVTWLLENNGHSAQVTYLSGDLLVSEGGLKGRYRVAQFHFHWGSNNSRGSEHTVHGKSYPLEMHIVTYNLAYENVSNALLHPDGLAVLAVLFKVKKKDNPSFQTLISALSDVTEPDSEIWLEPVPLTKLMPNNRKKFYRYNGSLTTPPCSQVVIWTIFRQPVGISASQLVEFRQLKSHEKSKTANHEPLVDNFRPIQDLNGRTIDYYRKIDEDDD